MADDDRRSYFIAPNVGKEAIALNLKDARAHEIVRRLLRELDVDVFCCNTVPSRYASLGIDPATLRAARPELIWAGISAMGPRFPEAPGYDPVLQAMAGYMEVTGDPNGPPMLSGIPVIDLKAGDDVYAEVMAALLEREETGQGRQIHVSMLQSAASWLVTTMPLLNFDCDPSEIGRAGNEHRKFIPTNAYPTADGFVFVAIGNDLQWKRLTQIPKFAGLARETRQTQEGRQQERASIHAEIAGITRRYTRAELMEDFRRATIPHAPIQTIAQVAAMEPVARKMSTSTMPDGRTIRLQPPAVDLDRPAHFAFPPRYGEHTASVLREAGVDDAECARLAASGVVSLGQPDPG